MGYIYILTNPSFPQYVKIGNAADVKQRLNELKLGGAVCLPRLCYIRSRLGAFR